MEDSISEEVQLLGSGPEPSDNILRIVVKEVQEDSIPEEVHESIGCRLSREVLHLFECEEYGRRFAWSDYLVKHRRSHSGQKSNKCKEPGTRFF